MAALFQCGCRQPLPNTVACHEHGGSPKPDPRPRALEKGSLMYFGPRWIVIALQVCLTTTDTAWRDTPNALAVLRSRLSLRATTDALYMRKFSLHSSSTTTPLTKLSHQLPVLPGLTQNLFLVACLVALHGGSEMMWRMQLFIILQLLSVVAEDNILPL